MGRHPGAAPARSGAGGGERRGGCVRVRPAESRLMREAGLAEAEVPPRLALPRGGHAREDPALQVGKRLSPRPSASQGVFAPLLDAGSLIARKPRRCEAF